MSSSFKTSGPPYSWILTAFIVSVHHSESRPNALARPIRFSPLERIELAPEPLLVGTGGFLLRRGGGFVVGYRLFLSRLLLRFHQRFTNSFRALLNGLLHEDAWPFGVSRH